MGKRRPFFQRQYGYLIKVTRSPFRREQILEGEELARDKRETLNSKLFVDYGRGMRACA